MITDVLIIKAGIAHRARENQYNGQEVGLCGAFRELGLSANVVCFSETVKEIEVSVYHSEITYIPCKRIGNQALINTRYLDHFTTKAVFIMADNKLFVNSIINYYLAKGITPVCYFGVLFSNSKRKILKLVSRAILEINRAAFSRTINVAKTKAACSELEDNRIHCDDIIPVGLDKSKLNMGEINREELRASLGYSSEDRLLLFVGRFVPEKMAPFFIELLSGIRKRDPHFKAIVIGSGAEKDLVLSKIEACSMEQYVRLIDSVQYAEMYQYYNAADCFVNLSKIEIFGMAILESMFYGCPVVAHSAPGPDSIIENGVTGYLLSDYKLEDWVDRIMKCSYEKQFSEVARNRIIDSFIWDKIACRIIEHFNISPIEE